MTITASSRAAPSTDAGDTITMHPMARSSSRTETRPETRSRAGAEATPGEAVITIDGGPIYFISDVHLGSPVGPREREQWLLELLARVPGRAAALFILGDLFDFWFEYRHAIPKQTFRVARALADALDSGVPVHYLGGNHDYWISHWLHEELGIVVHNHPLVARLQGRSVLLAHGDGLGPGDTGYKILRVVLRNRLAIAAYRAIHPDLGIPFAHLASRWSRDSRDDIREKLLPKIVRDVVTPLVQPPVDAMVMGHVHEPVHFRDEGREFLLIGDWLENFTHVEMEAGAFRLLRRVEGLDQEIPAEAFPACAPRRGRFRGDKPAPRPVGSG